LEHHYHLDPDLDRLLDELTGEGYAELLDLLKEYDPVFQRFPTWRDLTSFMWTSVSRDLVKESILRTVLEVHTLDRRPHWRTILLVFFWPGLRSLHRKKQKWTDDAKEFWQEIVRTFLEVVHDLDPRTTRMHPTAAIYWGTFHALYRTYAAQWKRDKTELQVDAEFIQAQTLGSERQPSKEDALSTKFEALLQSGHINEVEFHLLVGSFVHGHPLRTCAKEAGLSYEAAKKRRQRGLQKLKDLEEDSMSPFAP